MRQYGLLLENFATNSESTNDAIFTLMHHISGDLNSPEALYVPQILKAFSDIWEQIKSRPLSSDASLSNKRDGLVRRFGSFLWL